MANLILQCASPPFRTIDRIISEAPISPAARNTVYGVLRRFNTLSGAVGQRLNRPLDNKHRIINYLIMVGAHQILFERTATYAAVNECVDACRVLRRPWATGLVNAVLRSIDRSSEEILLQAERSFEIPDWLWDNLRASYGSRAEAIARGLLGQPSMAIRINRRRTPPENYALQLSGAGLNWHPTWAAETVLLDEPLPQANLPGFNEGAVSVQDVGAQFAARLLAPANGDRVLDLCAAPGGKLFHLMELYPDAHYTAVEVSESRAARILSEGERLGLKGQFELHTADARGNAWWDGKSFDRILLDAPCTGTGTIRRHPDIRIHRTADDIGRAAFLQTELLQSAWDRLGPHGRLLYCTCSILPQENDDIVGRFLAAHPDATTEQLALPTGIGTAFGWQLLPDDPRTDGFYYSLLQKAR